MRKKRDTPQQGEPTTATAKPSPTAGEDLEPTLLEDTAPCTPSPHLLAPGAQRFCQEYLLDLNATQAYLRSHPRATTETAGTEGWKYLQNPAIRAEIQRLLDERAQITGITTDRVLLRFWEQATADPRELVDLRVSACRHCWGLYNQRQYTDAEYERAQTEHVHAEKRRRDRSKRATAPENGKPFEPQPFPEAGGPGYDPRRSPHPECPECFGDGEPRAILKDLKQASPGALALFGGVKYDKAGRMSVLIRDPMPALKAVAEHLGMFNGDRAPDVTDPLTTLLEEIRGAHGAGSALPVIAHDPEARQQVTDVVAKPAPKAAPKPEPGSGFKPRVTAWRPAK